MLWKAFPTPTYPLLSTIIIQILGCREHGTERIETNRKIKKEIFGEPKRGWREREWAKSNQRRITNYVESKVIQSCVQLGTKNGFQTVRRDTSSRGCATGLFLNKNTKKVKFLWKIINSGLKGWKRLENTSLPFVLKVK